MTYANFIVIAEVGLAAADLKRSEVRVRLEGGYREVRGRLEGG